MKKIVRLFFVVFGIMLSAIPIVTRGQEKVNMPQFGKREIVVSDDILFYDIKGEEDIVSSSSNNACSSVVFKPAASGKAIQISFEYFDVYTDGSSFPAYLKVYNGIFDKENSFLYPTVVKDVTVSKKFPYLPSQLDSLDIGKKGIQLTNRSYVSTDQNGCLSVAYFYKYAGKCKGWKAKVSCVTVSNMQVTQAGSSYVDVDKDIYTGKKGVNLLSFFAIADGILNPDKLTSVSFTLPKNEGVIDPAQLKLYEGSQLNFSGMLPLNASLIEANGVYTFTFEKTLNNGVNTFSVVADIKDDAAFNAKLQMLATGVTTKYLPAGVSNFIAATNAPVIMLPRMVLISKTPAVYSVGDEIISFYDDGGRDGNISKNFTGQVTFKPFTQGKKVQITFTKIKLFDGSSAIYKDVLKIYNGTDVDEAKLNALLKSDNPVIVKSVAEDGSLTVTLGTDTSVPGAGFEATVSEFVPQSMVLASVVPVQYTNGSIAAGDIMQPILYFNIITENTEPILTASKFSFSTAGTFAKIGKATLYSTGKSPAFSPVSKVGEVNITADNYEITTSVSPTFTEGDNYFWLAYDINDNVSNGDKIDAAITGVLLSDGEHLVANGNPDGDRTVKNEYISVPGTFNKTINGEWGYSYICSSGYESLDHSVTFIPKSSDKIVELTFSNFNLYFPVSSIPVFKIYSGTNTTDNNKLLWKATSVNKIPEMNSHIRPLEGDAALTVVYNSNGISSSSSYGWTATVKEFLSVPMVFECADAFQASTNILKPGAKNQEIIGFKVVTAGDKSPLTLNEVLLNLKGSHDKVRRVYLYTSGKNNVFSAANSIAEGIPSVDNESLNLVLSAPLKLLEGESYYWIAYDMGESIAAEQSIDAALTSLKIGIETKIPVLGDPEGVRVTKNTLDLQSGDNGTIMVGDEPLMFYDNGGVDGKSPKNFDGTITFAPKSQGKVIKLIFKKWSIGGNDNMYIYYGGEKKSKEDIKCTSSKNTETIVSMSEDGKLTINFKSPTYSVNTDGWEIEVSSYTLAELSLGKIGVTAVNPLSLLKGMTDAPMLRVDVEVKGDKGTLDITRMVFDAAATIGAAAKSASLYCTDTISNFIADKKFAESVNTAPYIFNGNYRATLPGVYRFWLTYDITPIAKEFDEVKAKFVTLTANGKENTSAISPLASAVIKKGFNGIYTIGVSDAADYHTVAAAVAAMKDGIDGAVTFEMESGSYNELVTIPQIEGASALNTITLKSKTGRYHDVIIYSNQYIEPSYSDEKMFNEYGVFTVAGADYLTLDGVTITTTDMTFPSVVHIKNVSRNVTVKNCRIYTEMATTYTNDINLVYMYARDKANQNNDYFTLENCLIEGGYNGVRIGGTSYVNLPHEKGARILNNIFSNQGAKSIYIPTEACIEIKGNMISNTKTDKSDFNAIDVTADEGLTIANNIISLATKNYASGIYLRNVKGTFDKPGLMYNNEINLACAGNSASYGIKAASPSSYLNIVYNTVKITGTLASSAAMFVNDVMSNTVIKNNIFQNEAGGNTYRIGKTTYFPGTVYLNNILYTTNTGTFAYAGGNVADFEVWKTLSGETNSFVEKVAFFSETVLEPKSSVNLKNAAPMEWIKSDINGNTRNALTPTIGAYEYADVSVTPTLATGYPLMLNISHDGCLFAVKTAFNGKVFAMIKPANDVAPAQSEMLISGKSIETRKDYETVITIGELNSQSEYKLYVVLQDLRGQRSEVLTCETFTTTYSPNEISTFENVTITEGGFLNGTASFNGFEPMAITDGVGTNNTKAAKIKGVGVVTLTNSVKGLDLTGFYIKSDAEISVTAYDAAHNEKHKTVSATNDKWIFCNLRDMGKIVSVKLESTGDAYIDNFSGQPQPIFFAIDGKSANEGESVSLSTQINGGVPPYTYRWTNAKKTVLSTTADYTFVAQHTGEYSLTVTDVWSNSLTQKTVVKVNGSAYVATFEDLYLETESHWRGDETGVNMNSTFYSGSYEFNNYLMKDYDTWEYFGYSNETSVGYATLNDQFHSAVGSGTNSSETYAVVYAMDAGLKMTVTNKTEGDLIQGCYVTNTAWVKDAILNGDGISTVAGGFVSGDYFVLTAKGKRGDGTTVSVDYYLADYRSENIADHFCLDTWEWFDLRPLGKVKEVTFSMNSTKQNKLGMTTPAYFCIDDMNGLRNITEGKPQIVGVGEYSIELTKFFIKDNALANVTYKIEDDCDKLAIDASVLGTDLILTTKQEGTYYLVISATQKGKKQFVRIPITVDVNLNVESIPTSTLFTIYPTIAKDKLNIVTDMEKYAIEVISINGVKVIVQENNYGNAVINVGNLKSGVYILNVCDREQTKVKRFTKVD